MTNILLAAIGGIFAANLGPIKSALTTAETNPQEAVSLLNGLIPTEIGALPSLENEAIAAGSKLALEEIAKLEAKFAEWTSGSSSSGTAAASPPAVAPAPAPAPQAPSDTNA